MFCIMRFHPLLANFIKLSIGADDIDFGYYFTRKITTKQQAKILRNIINKDPTMIFIISNIYNFS